MGCYFLLFKGIFSIYRILNIIAFYKLYINLYIKKEPHFITGVQAADKHILLTAWGGNYDIAT
ncbi:hypothetical protein B2H94_00340 [Clostridium sporogenes]|uniref:Uncharacterized protein n=2 Tax=Clostridium TaxID=1485 RepID=A0AAE6I3P8_CLOSG|nr:hypothetical protein CLOSPO_01163 [Clostridium sporogenes ATCC 15579]KIS22497.1 hypothetical protein N495_02460 [Clostridium botulinum B2 450]OSB17616.1 hypothetical protein B2H94_00340 [Clostridium sporogenes]QDY31282.1 hypothetical protein CGS26_02600 [Clostridium sporogenes]